MDSKSDKETPTVVVNDFSGKFISLRVSRQEGKEDVKLLDAFANATNEGEGDADTEDAAPKAKKAGGLWSSLKNMAGYE